MAFVNLGFELEGAKQGTALGWHLLERVTSEELAGFRESDMDSVSVVLNDGAKWLTMDASITAGALDPYGGAGAYLIGETAGISTHGVMYADLQTCAAGKPMSFGAWLKANTEGYAFIGYATGLGACGVFFDLVNGRVLDVLQPVEAIEKVGVQVGIYAGGWYRVECTITPVGASQPVNPVILLSRDGATFEFDEAGLARSVFGWMPYTYEGAAHNAEGFELAWNNAGYVVQLAPVQLELASFEGFESGWANFPYLYAVAASEEIAPEGFESGWDNDGYLLAFLPAHVAAGSTDAFTWITLNTELTIDDFEASWMLDTFSDATAEDFENVFDDAEVTADPTADTFNASNIPFVNGQRVQILNVTGQMPGGVYSTTEYFVSSKNPTNFKITVTYGGAVVDITSRETGKLIARMVGNQGWNGPTIL